MGIKEFFKKKQEQKSTTKSLILKDFNNAISLKTNNKKLHNLYDFIENAIISNGGNYNDIKQKLISLSEFSQYAKDYGIKCNLLKIDETLNDFFTKQKNIKFQPINNQQYSAFYNKKDGYNKYNYRGVTIFQDQQTQKPIMYFGRRNENAETHQKDTLFEFGNDYIILKDQNKASYDGIPIFGSGTYAEFTFDENNQISSIKYRYMTHPRLGIWSDEHCCIFDIENNQYKQISNQTQDISKINSIPNLYIEEKSESIIVSDNSHNDTNNFDM